MDARTSARPGTGQLALVSGALVGWNAAMNLAPVPRAAYVPANLGLAGASVLLARRSWGLSPPALGLSRGGLARGARLGGSVLVPVGAALATAAALPATRELPAARGLAADARIVGLGPAGVAYWALVRIPLGTALAEELVFRSTLLGGCAARLGWRRGVAWSSAVFGLWHIGPTLAALRVNGVTRPARVAAGVTGAVAATGAAGVALSWLRRWGGHVATPALTHLATNVGSLLAAVAVRRARRCRRLSWRHPIPAGARVPPLACLLPRHTSRLPCSTN